MMIRLGQRSFGQIIDAHAEQPADAGRAHGDAVNAVGLFDRAPVVGDDHELRLRRPFLQRVDEAFDVRLVERRVYLVEDAERRRPHVKQREQERDGGQGALAAGEQAQSRDALAGWLRFDINAESLPLFARFRVVVRADLLLGQDELSPAAAEH